MSGDDEAAALFERERPRLVGLAYRLIGSLSDAEDVAQETWLRWQRVDRATIERPAAWLTTVASRIGLDRLRARQRERADYVGPWLPEPLVERVSLGAAPAAADPAVQAELADSLTTAFLLMLERLRPEERLAVLLADVFGEPYGAVAEVLQRDEASCRQLASRARRKLRDTERPRPSDPPAEAWAVAIRFIEALQHGDVEAATALLAPDVVLRSDGGAHVRAARQPVIGPDRVARFMGNVLPRGGPAHVAAGPGETEMEPVTANGSPAQLYLVGGRPTLVGAVDVSGGLIHAITIVLNPDKLVHALQPVELR